MSPLTRIEPDNTDLSRASHFLVTNDVSERYAIHSTVDGSGEKLPGDMR